ncbi:hypothetical protein KJ966_19850 [bacterium]|nr:hypothetical protein [bacterium]
MFSKKLFPIVAAALLLTGLSSNAYAEFFSVSIGLPVAQTFSNEWAATNGAVESDGISGAMVHVKFPIMVGLGFESYVSKIKSYDEDIFDDLKLTTNMVDFFWLTSIPIVNFTIGAGLGQSTFDCEFATGSSCSDHYDPNGLTWQWYAQLGFTFFPFLDAHLSYQNVSATVVGKDDTDNITFKSSVYALGVAFIF